MTVRLKRLYHLLEGSTLHSKNPRIISRFIIDNFPMPEIMAYRPRPYNIKLRYHFLGGYQLAIIPIAWLS
jgi:hypothetical protein